MATFPRRNRALLQTILKVTRPHLHPQLTSSFSYQPRCSRAASGFSVSFPLEFDESSEPPPSPPKTAALSPKPRSKAPPKTSRALDARKGKDGVRSSKTGDRLSRLKENEPPLPEDKEIHDSLSQCEAESERLSSRPPPPFKDHIRPPRPSARGGFYPREHTPSTSRTKPSTPPPRPTSPSLPSKETQIPKRAPEWRIQKAALLTKLGPNTPWNPRKKLSPDTLDGIRALHAQYPDKYPTEALAAEFKVSPEAIRRILRSRWKPASDADVEDRRKRWARRHDRIWDHQAALGLRPARIRERAEERAEEFEERMRAREILGRR